MLKLALILALSAAVLGFAFDPVPAWADQAAENTRPVVVEEARIESAPGVVLAATIRLPQKPGRHPVVLFQSGSGENRRGAFTLLENRLNAAGIATIEFDKRGVGQSSGTFTDTMQDMEADLVATLRWLRNRPDIDTSRIALLGHSQGAAVAPTVARNDGGIAAVVFLAGPVGERGSMFLALMRDQLIESGHPADRVDGITAATRVWMEARAKQQPAEVQASTRAGVVSAFMAAGFAADSAEKATSVLDSPQLLSMYLTAPRTALEAIDIPVLAIFAARDEIVGDQAAATAAALGENSRALVIQVPGASHNFGYRRPDAPPRENPMGGPWLSLLPTDMIVSWLKEQLVAGHRDQGH